SMLSPSFSPRTSTTDRGSRIARLFPHFATRITTSEIYNYVMYILGNGDFRGWDELTLWFQAPAQGWRAHGRRARALQERIAIFVIRITVRRKAPSYTCV